MKDKHIAAILALFMGALGIHKFYLGHIGAGILYLVFSFTFVPAILGLIDFFALVLMENDEFNRRYNGSNMLPGQGPVVVNMLPLAGGYPGGAYGLYGYGLQPGVGGADGQQQRSPTITSADDLKVQLETLNELCISGLLTEVEFQAQKKKLLDMM